MTENSTHNANSERGTGNTPASFDVLAHRPVMFDGALALLLTGQMWLAQPVDNIWVWVGASLLLGSALTLRRAHVTFSVVAFSCALVIAFIESMRGYQFVSFTLVAAILIFTYTSQANRAGPYVRALGFLGIFSAATVLVLMLPVSTTVDSSSRMWALAVVWLLLVVCALSGLIQKKRTERIAALVDRAQLQATLAQTERELAVAAERNRIARDMHDMLGHSLTTIVAQAEGARRILTSDPMRVEAALCDSHGG